MRLAASLQSPALVRTCAVATVPLKVTFVIVGTCGCAAMTVESHVCQLTFHQQPDLCHATCALARSKSPSPFERLKPALCLHAQCITSAHASVGEKSCKHYGSKWCPTVSQLLHSDEKHTGAVQSILQGSRKLWACRAHLKVNGPRLMMDSILRTCKASCADDQDSVLAVSERHVPGTRAI